MDIGHLQEHSAAQLPPNMAVLQALLAASADMVTVSDRDGKILYASPSTEHVTGYTVDEFIAQHPFGTIHPADLPQCEAAFARLLASPGLSLNLEHRFLHKDGSWRWLEGTFTNLYDEPTLGGLVAHLRDITTRKEAVAALRDSEERYRTLFASIDEGFCIIEILLDDGGEPADYRFLEINPLFERMTGLEHAVGKTARELVQNLEDFWVETYGAVALTGEAVRFEHGSDAMQRWFEVYTSRFGAPERRQVAIVFKDITERKQAESELARLYAAEQAARAEAEAALQVRDQFLSIASHELRNPLTSLLGYANMLSRAVERQGGDPKTQRMAEMVIQQAQRLNGMIGQLLDVSRFQQGQFEVQLQRLDLVAHVVQVVDTFRMTLPPSEQMHRIVLRHHADQLLVCADPPRLEEVFHNVLSNAVKYSPGGQPVLLQVMHQSGEAIVEIVDQGIGIPADAQAHLFMPFYRAHNVGSQTSGFGIGLYVVREIVQRHGGRIEIKSGLGEGSTFRIVLPLHAKVV